MLDIKFIRQNPDKVKEGIAKKHVKIDIDELLEIDKKRRQCLQALEDMRAQKNKANEEIKRAKGQAEKDVVILKMRELDTNSDRLTNDFQETDKQFQEIMLQIPNLPDETVPEGKDDTQNVVLREVGDKPKFGFEPKDYMAIAERLDLIDVKRAGKVSGTRFGYIKGKLALLEFGLIKLAFDVLVKEGFVPIIPPVVLKAEMARGMGYLEQADEKEAYYLPQDDLYLVGTSEQSIGVMHADEILEEKDLPRRYAGFSTCFRREAGAYGKDTKGILRVHQFDKVEMFSFCHPQKSKEEHRFLLSIEERLMKDLKIPYRIVQLCSGDLGRPSVSTIDTEVWLPGQGEYREVNSTSNCTDFQARRLNIRYRAQDGPAFVHTLNGTAFAIGRILIAIIENYQQKDGSVVVPKVLQKYVGFKKIA